ncbi:class I mannose-6-phosphate isomerase [Sphingobium sp. AN641]|uniref:class I mannose-6-phosphate isomerase n=1 Tax=Sphingobium sp. AN641 TaxID=3133443 RepID=UPI0030C49534
MFTPPAGRRIGEVWFDRDGDEALPLLVKYIFTSERLSIQVHPDDVQARAAGLAGGKEECWYILDCAPDAVLGIGLTKSLTPEDFAAAARDGSIEQLIEWKPVKPGDFYFIRAGTVHAIGANIALAEIQQNADVTYRLYDYGRPRELHLRQGQAVSRLAPYDRPALHANLGESRSLLSPGEAPFAVNLCHLRAGQATLPLDGRPLWFLPLRGIGTINGAPFDKGECWLIDDGDDVAIETDCDALVAAVS